MQFFQAIVMSILLYGGNTQTMLDKHLGSVSTVYMFQAYMWHLEDSPYDRIAHGQDIAMAHGHVPNVEILARCHTLHVES